MSQLSEAEVWSFRLAPLSSALVWGAYAVAGNRGWLGFGYFTSYPVYVTFVMTTMTCILYLISLPLLKRFYIYSRDRNLNVAVRIFLSGLVFGSAWGWFWTMLAPAYKLFGPACGAVVGLTLSIALKQRRVRGDFGESNLGVNK